MYRRKGSYAITDAADGQVVTTAEAKAHLRLDSSDDDSYVEELLAAAVEKVENDCGVWLLTREAELYLDGFPFSRSETPTSTVEICIEKRPVTAVNSIKYYDSSNQEQTLDSAVYQVDLKDTFPRIVPVLNESWPDTYERLNSVTINFDAGYENAAAVPKGFKHAIKLLIADWHKNRGDSEKGADTRAYKALVNQLKVRAR